MPSHNRRRSTRDRPAKAPLSEGLIVDTALGILRAEGLDAVTMRRVAAALDTGPASLYVYVDGTRELGEAMLERVVASIPLEQPDATRWRDQVIDLMRAALRAFQAHPGIARVLMFDRGLGRSFDLGFDEEGEAAASAAGANASGRYSWRFIETLLGMLHAGGIDARDATWACEVLSLITAAAAIEIPTQGRDNTPEPASEPRAEVRGEEAPSDEWPDRFPLATKWAEEFRSGTGDQRFSFAIQTFLEGLVARHRGNG